MVGQGTSLEWTDDTIQVKDARIETSKSPVPVSELDLARAKNLDCRNASIEFDLFYVEFSIQENEEDRPHFSKMSAGLDRKTGMALYQHLFDGTNVVEHAQQALLELIEQNGFRPREVWMTSKVKVMLASLIKPQRIDVMAVENLQNIAQLKQFLSEME